MQPSEHLHLLYFVAGIIIMVCPHLIPGICGYVMFHSKEELKWLKWQAAIKHPDQLTLTTDYMPWATQVDPMSSQESLEVEKGGRSV